MGKRVFIPTFAYRPCSRNVTIAHRLAGIITPLAPSPFLRHVKVTRYVKITWILGIQFTPCRKASSPFRYPSWPGSVHGCCGSCAAVRLHVVPALPSQHRLVHRLRGFV